MKKYILLGCFVFISFFCNAQHIAIKSNVLELGLSSPNLGFEFVLSRKLSLELSSGYNNWGFKDRINYFRLQPELRYWFQRPLIQHALGVSLLYLNNNIKADGTRFDGDIVGGGLTYGYSCVLGERWNLEVGVGAGMVRCKQFKWEKNESKPEEPNVDKWTFAPIKCGVSFVYIIR
ncbi:MAG: DUF3575 domain-containing protein [Marinifilaceae bacterium]